MEEGDRAGAYEPAFDIGRRMQMLGVEYSGLTSARSLACNEASSRASMFLTVLSAAVVALALVSQAADFHEPFVLFALMLLPVVLFIGLATYVRLVQVNTEDIFGSRESIAFGGHGSELGPGVQSYLVTDFRDDDTGIAASTGHRGLTFGVAHAFVTAPGMVGVVDAVNAAMLAALVTVVCGGWAPVAAAAGVAAFLVTIAVLALVQLREVERLRRDLPQRYPTPPPELGRRSGTIAMLRMAVGHSAEFEPGPAIADALAQCRPSLEGMTPSAALVFSAFEAFDGIMARTLREAFPGIQIIGSTSAAADVLGGWLPGGLGHPRADRGRGGRLHDRHGVD